MRRFYLEDPSRAYPRVPVLISIVLGCLGWDNNLVETRRAVILY